MEFHKKKWQFQAKQRGQHVKKKNKMADDDNESGFGVIRNPQSSTLSGFLRRAQKKLLQTPWQIVEVYKISLFHNPAMCAYHRIYFYL